MAKTSKTSKVLKKPPAKAKAPAKPAKGASAKTGSVATKEAPKKDSSKKPAPKKEAAEAKGLKKKLPEKEKAAAAPARKGATESAGGGGASAPQGKAPVKGGGKTGAPKGSGGKGVATSVVTPPSTSAPSVKAPPAAVAEDGADKSADKKKAGPKGITIIQPKPSKPSKPKPKFQLPQGEPLLKPGAKWKPLIPSGPGAPPRHELGHAGQAGDAPIKSKLSKKELDKYRQVLLAKRSELVGDVRNMESEALLQNSGSLSHTPQHMAEQGTDVFDQSLNLDLAAVDRTLIREIDAALERIEAGTYGICEFTGKPISTERLDELPWTRYSIEAARERERRSYQP